MHATGVATLIETIEDMFQTVFIDAHPIIGDREFKMSIAILIRNVFQAYGNFSSIITILKGIGKQIGNHLVKLCLVNPSLETFQPLMVECETYVTLPSREIKHSTDTFSKSHNVCLLAMQLHLLLVNLTYIENLIDEIQDSLCIMLDSIDSRITHSRLVVACP